MYGSFGRILFLAQKSVEQNDAFSATDPFKIPFIMTNQSAATTLYDIDRYLKPVKFSTTCGIYGRNNKIFKDSFKRVSALAPGNEPASSFQ